MSNPVDYFEIGSPDPEAARAFYSGLFDWEIGPPSAARYSTINTQDGGLWDTSEMGGGSWAIFYVHVDNVSDALDKAVALGATVVIPLVNNGQIEFAHLQDPLGNRFAIWRPNTPNA
ncbi:hypothetical protein GCM10022381_38520 [Leifsonia kafniensis]|uniref:VOC domain-containing protein n=1 Tax=Leifsonia kafniensis TaxID=475957 RepID=A0ABP7L2J8_9MICO